VEEPFVGRASALRAMMWAAGHDGRGQVRRFTRRVAAVAAAVLTLALSGCSNMDAKDQAVLDRLAKLDIVAVPANATPIDQTSEKGGGADPFIRTASTYTVVYFLPRPPLQVRDKFLARFPRWDLLDDGPPLANLWRALGRLDSSDTVVAVNVRTPAPADDAPDPNGSVVTVQASAVRRLCRAGTMLPNHPVRGPA
jgi:hypothetical protein